MADDINKKISIDVQVNTDGQEQIDLYKTSFDNLRSTKSNLGKPISALSNNIKSLNSDISGFSDTLSKLKAQNQSVTSSGNEMKDTIVDMSVTFRIWNTVVKACREGFILFEASISGGLAVLTVFAPEIIKWIGNLFKADTTTKSLNQTLKEHKLVIQAVNQCRLQGDQNAQQELVYLKLLYTA